MALAFAVGLLVKGLGYALAASNCVKFNVVFIGQKRWLVVIRHENAAFRHEMPLVMVYRAQGRAELSHQPISRRVECTRRHKTKRHHLVNGLHGAFTDRVISILSSISVPGSIISLLENWMRAIPTSAFAAVSIASVTLCAHVELIIAVVIDK